MNKYGYLEGYVNKEAASFRGRLGGKAAGPGGICVCPKCGAGKKHSIGKPCTDLTCPKCGAKMDRK